MTANALGSFMKAKKAHLTNSFRHALTHVHKTQTFPIISTEIYKMGISLNTSILSGTTP